MLTTTPLYLTSFTIINTYGVSSQTSDLVTESATKLTSPIDDNINHNDHMYDYVKLSSTTNWSKLCLCPLSYLNRHVCTALVVLHEEHIYQLRSSNFEVYSSGMLRLNRHYRINRPPTMINDPVTATFIIPATDPFHIDKKMMSSTFTVMIHQN